MDEPTSPSPTSCLGLVIRGALFGLAVLVTSAALVVLISIRSDAGDQGFEPQKARAAVAWAGFPDHAHTRPVAFGPGDLHGGGWHLVWEATPEEADRLLASGSFAAPYEACAGEPAPDDRWLVVSDCRTARDSWRRPDGNVIERRVVRGRTGQGTDILYLHVVDPD